MQPLLTAAAMRAADQTTIDDFGIGGFTLMETAGRAAADAIEAQQGPVAGRTVCILCGKGNNGGDGFVVARVLHARGAIVRVLLTAPDADLSPDAAAHLTLLRRLAAQAQDHRLHLLSPAHTTLDEERHADLYVDALLGTGLASPLRAPLDALVDWLNERPQPTVALDVPTGLHSDTGAVLGTAVQASMTVTMGARKQGLYLGAGPQHAGHVVCAEIGIPAFALTAAREKVGGALMPTDADLQAWLPRRAAQAHKYTAGMALVVGGAPGLTGAPTMAATAAARVGAGAVVCATPAPLQPTLAAKLTEVMTAPLPTTPGGDALAPEAAVEALRAPLDRARALLVGCGLGRAPETAQFVRRLLRHTTLPCVVDADGLNALAGHTELLTTHAAGRCILTPHAGEFHRLAGETVDLADRVAVVRRYAAQWGVVLVLKGRPSVVGIPGGTVYVVPAGNAALATAGTGDVLAGLCAGLLAQGLSPERAAVCALHLGGRAAERYTATRGEATMLATDLLAQLPSLLHDRFDR